MRRWPIRVRITAVAAVVMAAALALTGFVLLQVVRSSQLAELRTSAKRRAEEVVALVSKGKATGPLPAARDDALLVQVIDVRGHVIASSLNASDMNAFVNSGDLASQPGVMRRSRGNVDRVPCEILATGVDVGSKRFGVFVASPLRAIEHTQGMLRSRLLRGIPFLLAGVILAIWLVTGRALRPVDLMRRELDAITPGDLGARVSAPPVDDELGRLARTMNAMLERLQASSDRQTRFVSDASHELRTPLAVTRARLEVALRHPQRTDWPQAANIVLRESGRMERLVRDLLLIARGEQQVRNPRQVDLDEVAMGAIRSARLVAPSGHTIDGHAVSAGRVLGDPDLLDRVVTNLLANAVRHSQRQVAVSVVRRDAPVGSGSATAVVELAVTDDGPGVPEADRTRIFERFTRLDEARDRQSGGAGLGLSIVHDVVVGHGGTVHVEDGPAGGARFVVRLPAAD